MIRHRPRALAASSLAGLVTALFAISGIAPAQAAPPTPFFGPAIDAYAAYDPQRTTCSSTEQPGVVDFKNLLNDAYGAHTWDILRACNDGDASEHKEGRALDYSLNVNNADDRAVADDILNWLLATDQYGNRNALARRLGMMYIIWNRQMWRSYSDPPGWGPYTGRNPHTDHIHFSFSWAGARQQTSWWTGSGPGPVGADRPAVIDAGALHVFRRGANGHLLQTWWNGSGWSPGDLGGTIVGSPTPVVYGGLNIFARDAGTGTVRQWYWLNDQWNLGDAGGGFAGDMAAIVAGPNLHLFARGSNGHLIQKWWNGSGWSTVDLGGNIVGTPVAVDFGGLNVFARTPSGSVQQWYWLNDQWNMGTVPGGFTSDVAAIVAGPNLHLFGRGASGQLRQNWWTGNSWAVSELGGNLVGAPVVVDFGGLNVFARTTAGSVQQWYWLNGQWNIGAAPGGFASDMTVTVAGPNLHLFAKGANGHLLQDWWTGSGWATADLG